MIGQLRRRHDRTRRRARLLMRRPKRIRTPVILQMTATDCGAACLAMVLGYWGIRLSLAACRDRLGIGRDGVSGRDIASAARAYGLTVGAFLATPESLRHMPMPAIVHWEADHFVVLERVTARNARIVDPAFGRRRVGRNELAALLSGAVLTFETSKNLEPGKALGLASQSRETAWPRELLGPLASYAKRIAPILAISLILQILSLAGPLATATLLSRPNDAYSHALIGAMPLLICMLVAIHFAATQARQLTLIRLEKTLDTRLATRVVGHLLKLPLSFFEQRSSADLRQRVGSTFQIREVLTAQTLEALLDGIMMIGYLTALFIIDAEYGALMITVALAQLTLLLGSSGKARRLRQRQLLAEGKSQSALQEMLDGIATVKAMACEQQLMERWQKHLATELATKERHDRFEGTVDNATTCLRTLGLLLALWLGVRQIESATLSPGTVIALQTLSMSVLLPMSSMASAATRLRSIRVHLERMRDIVRAPIEASVDDGHVVGPLQGGLELREVNFRYSTHAPAVLRNISLTIKPGSTVAIVGTSGSGKSTLAMLLLGLYRPSGGEVCYDGHAGSELDPRALRRQMGVVLQDNFIFADSIRTNLALADPELAEQDLIRAARQAAIHNDITTMPMGYATRVGEGGNLVSGGQRQRIALARALVHDPAILLLDEATSHLDAITEHEITAEINELPCTQIIIAHRLSTIRAADEIFVLERGELIEQGTHEDLLVRNGTYAALVRGQQLESSDRELF